MPDHPLYAALGRALEDAVAADPNVVVVTSDTARDHFCYHLQEKYPMQAVDCGICEQHMVSMASALALAGKKPIVLTYARFLTRAYEQIYNQMTERTAVVYVGSLAGPLPASGPGESHEVLEDGEAMRTLGLRVVQPYEADMVGAALRIALEAHKSTYVRLIHVT